MNYIIYTDYFLTRMYFTPHDSSSGFSISTDKTKAKKYSDKTIVPQEADRLAQESGMATAILIVKSDPT